MKCGDIMNNQNVNNSKCVTFNWYVIGEEIIISSLDNKIIDGIIGFAVGDDTSMVLATMDSIIETKEINYDNMMSKFCNWLETGKYSSLDTVFDVSIITKYSILRY